MSHGIKSHLVTALFIHMHRDDVLARDHRQTKDAWFHSAAGGVRLQVLRAGSKDDVLVPVGTEEAAHQGATVAHLHPQALVEPPA